MTSASLYIEYVLRVEDRQIRAWREVAKRDVTVKSKRDQFITGP